MDANDNTVTKQFPWIGEQFESQDPRSEGRVIKLTTFATQNGYEWPEHYHYEVLANPYNPALVGKPTKRVISAATLHRTALWRKISH